MATDWTSGPVALPSPTPDHADKKTLKQYHNAVKACQAESKLFESSGVLWWKRYFDVMGWAGFLPFGIHWSSEARKFELRSNGFQKLMYIIWMSLTVGYTSEFFEILFTSQKPRIQSVQAFMAIAGANLFMGVSATICWRRGQIVDVMNCFVEVWLERHLAVTSLQQDKDRRGHKWRRSQRWYCTVAVAVMFFLLNFSIYVQTPYECGFQWPCVAKMLCSNRRLQDSCNGSSPGFLAVYLTLARYASTMIDFCGDFFLVACFGFHGWVLDDFVPVSVDEPIDSVLKHYQNLMKLLELFNVAAGLPMLLLLGGALPYYIGTLPDLAMRFINNEFDFEYTRATICYCYYFGTYFWGASKYSKAKERLRRWADRPETVAKASANMEYQMALLGMKTDSKLDFSPCGWFTVDPDFCKAIISFSATYAIILVQLQQSKPSNSV